MPGPVPKRTDERMGHRSKADDLAVTKIDVAELVRMEMLIPEANEDWHPIARHFYVALQHSGQAVFYEPSDWAMAYTLCESLSRELKPVFIGMRSKIERDTEGNITYEDNSPVFETMPIKGSSMASFLRGWSVLGVAEGDRRRMQMEVTRPQVAHQIEGAPKPAGLDDDILDLIG